MLYGKEKVKQFLPHRDPFLFIHGIKSIVFPNLKAGQRPQDQDIVGSSVVGYFQVLPEMPMFQGHFPGNPILPGVIQIEMMAQAAGFPLTVIHENLWVDKIEMALLSVTNSKFRKPIRPQMEIDIHVTCTKRRGPVFSYDGVIKNQDEVLSESSFLASIKIL